MYEKLVLIASDTHGQNMKKKEMKEIFVRDQLPNTT